MIKCPKCSEEVPGVVSEETFKTRLANQSEKIKEQAAQLEEATKSRKIAEDKATKYDAVAAELAGLKRKAEISEAVAAAGLNAEVQPDRLRRLVEADYAEHVAAEGDKAKPMAEWLKAIAAEDVTYTGWRKSVEPVADASKPTQQPDPKVERPRPPTVTAPKPPDPPAPTSNKLRDYVNNPGAVLPPEMVAELLPQAPRFGWEKKTA